MISPFTHYKTNIPVQLNNNGGDNCSFHVLPDNTKVVSAINMEGDFIKKIIGFEIVDRLKLLTK